APYPFYVLFLMHRTIDSFLLYSLFLPITFFSSSFCYHRDLHSFPTRRSSDLGYAVRFMAYGGAMMVSSGNTFRCIDTSQEIVMTGFEENEETENMDADDRAFDLRIREYEPMIQSITGRLNVRFDQDDYMQVGRLAVYNALSTFDDIAARGATESQFVYTRIYQRMIDEIRRVSRYTNNVSATDDDVLMENTGAA